jgi:hypothetical protein
MLRVRLVFALAAVAALAGLSAGCGQLPRPFQPEGKTVDLRALADRQVLHVLPPTGAPVAALEAHGLRATAAGGPRNRTIGTHARIAPTGDGSELLALVAQVAEPDGTPLVRVQRDDMLPAGAWAEAEPFVVAEIADRLAEDLAAALAPAPIEQVALPGFPGARLVVLPISGAPGDGADSLPAALRAELERRDLPLARDPGPEDLLIAGRVEVVPDGPGAERATISWRLLRTAPDGAPGEEIGRIAQANRIPEGSLDGRWGQVARLVADYAADGLEDLLGQAAARDR